RQRGQRTGAVLVVHLRGAFQQARMDVEDVARIGFAARRTAQQQRHLAVGDGLLGQIVIDDHGMHAVVTEVLAHGAAGIRRQELQRGRLRRGGGDHDGVFQRARLFQRLHHLRDGRALLADRDIDAVQLLLLVARGVDRLLVQDGIDGDGGLAGLAVADDQLALAAADGHQRVERLQAGLHRLVHRLARDDARRLHFHAGAGHVGQRALAIDRIAERIDHTAEQALADRNVDDGAGALDGVAFLDAAVVAEDHDADVVGLKVQGHALHAARELDHLAGLHLVEAVDAGDAVADAEHLADLGHFGFGAEILDLGLQDFGNFCGADVHHATPFMADLRLLSFVRIEASIMREPSLTTRPPIRPGSTLALITTLPAAADDNEDLSCWSWASSSGTAEVTSASASPRCWLSSARKSRMMSLSAKSRRFCAAMPRKRRTRSWKPARSATAAIARDWSSRLKAGERAGRVRSAESASLAERASRSLATASSWAASRARSNSAVA